MEPYVNSTSPSAYFSTSRSIPKSFLKNKSTHGKKVLPFIVDQLCVDIDNKNDFEYASFLIKRKKLRFKL